MRQKDVVRRSSSACMEAKGRKDVRNIHKCMVSDKVDVLGIVLCVFVYLCYGDSFRLL